MTENPVRKMKELIDRIKKADEAYYDNDSPIMTDLEYDSLVNELKQYEHDTGIVFSESPTKKVGGNIKDELKSVVHTKPMLSCQKTKLIGEVIKFVGTQNVVVSWKLDGLALILRYDRGEFVQAITRGKDGLVGEDVTHTVKFFRNIPHRVSYKGEFEVRGEGVCSWDDFEIIKKADHSTHPRSVAAGAVRSIAPDEGKLSHLDFIAFELIRADEELLTKSEQLDFLLENDFDVVEHQYVEPITGELEAVLSSFAPEDSVHPVDGIIVEYDDIRYGRSLGATSHHENRMIALKWQDEQYETVFRGVELNTTRNGAVEINAVFDPVEIEGVIVRKANIHGLSGFESLCLGVGDIIKVYKANRIVPQVSENVTKSGTFVLPEHCPCCGTKLIVNTSSGGTKRLICTNEECLSRNAQRIARYCDKKAMNIDGLSAAVIGILMEHGFIQTIKDIYHLSANKKALLNAKGLRVGDLDSLFERIEHSRNCTLGAFLLGVGIPQMGPESAKKLDEYFDRSFCKFESAIRDGYNFNRIDGISYALNMKIHEWYESEKERAIWVPLIEELKFKGDTASISHRGHNGTATLCGKKVSIVGLNDSEKLSVIQAELSRLGIELVDQVQPDTDYLLVALK